MIFEGDLAFYGIWLLYICGVSFLCVTLFGWVNFMRSRIITTYIPAFVLTFYIAAGRQPR